MIFSEPVDRLKQFITWHLGPSPLRYTSALKHILPVEPAVRYEVVKLDLLNLIDDQRVSYSTEGQGCVGGEVKTDKAATLLTHHSNSLFGQQDVFLQCREPGREVAS